MAQNFLILFTKTAEVTDAILAWKSKWFLDKSIKPPIISYNNLAPKLTWIHNAKIVMRKCKNSSAKPKHNAKLGVTKFDGSFLKQSKIIFDHRNVVNIFILYELDTRSTDLNIDFVLGDSLFEEVK